KKKLAYIVSQFMGRDYPFEWLCRSAIARDYDLSFILLNPGPGEFETLLGQTGVKIVRFPYAGKKDLPRAIAQLALHLRKTRTDIVHAHLFGACMAGLTAARIAGVPRRIYTRHHSTVNHVYFRHAIIYDRIFNFLATDIIATCQNVREVLMKLEGVPSAKINVVNFGFQLADFEAVSRERVDGLRTKYELTEKRPVVGVIAKYIEWKGIQYAIAAFHEVLKVHPDACLVLANAHGAEYAATIKKLLSRLPAGSYREIDFEQDFMALYQLFDVFVHTPVDASAEAFGQIYVEALAASIPSVFTLSGIAREFVVQDQNALVVGYRDSAATAQAILKILGDRELARRLTLAGRKDVVAKFYYQQMIDNLGKVYA
ncbi:MAG: glycosyltransferase family 4 protein, partial [Deltaproteobacteria bacterium]|nr:glycosyltransferase family 4 protein [Deltaproteobacteria bacterium]